MTYGRSPQLARNAASPVTLKMSITWRADERGVELDDLLREVDQSDDVDADEEDLVGGVAGEGTARAEPRSTTFVGPGSSMKIPTSSRTSLSGAHAEPADLDRWDRTRRRRRPAGRARRDRRGCAGALRTGSSANSTLPAAPDVSRSRSASVSARRLMPMRPPKPVMREPVAELDAGENRTPITMMNDVLRRRRRAGPSARGCRTP